MLTYQLYGKQEGMCGHVHVSVVTVWLLVVVRVEAMVVVVR